MQRPKTAVAVVSLAEKLKRLVLVAVTQLPGRINLPLVAKMIMNSSNET